MDVGVAMQCAFMVFVHVVKRAQNTRNISEFKYIILEIDVRCTISVMVTFFNSRYVVLRRWKSELLHINVL